MAVAVRNVPQLECEIVTDSERLEEIAADWQRLWASSERSEVFQHFGWARACWKAFGDKMSLLTPVVYRGSELIGILPLAVINDKLQFLTSPLSDFNDVICEDEMAGDVVSAAMTQLLRLREHWATGVLDNVPSHSRLARSVAELQPRMDRYLRSVFKCPCPTIELDETGDTAAQLARKTSLKRHENHLRKRGEVSFKHIESPQEIERHLEMLFQQHMGRRAMAGQRSQFLEPSVCAMFRALGKEFDPRTLLRFSVLSVDERPVAYHFGFQIRKKLVVYQLAFDVDYWRSSPGEVMFRHLLYYARDHKLLEFDLTRGGEIYKDRFAPTFRSNLTMYLNHDLSVRQVMQLGLGRADGAAREALEKLRKYPRAYKFARTTVVGAIDCFRRERQLRRAQGASYGRSLIRRACRSCVFELTGKTTFAMKAQEVKQRAGLSSVDIPIVPTRLSELAIVAALHPELNLPLLELREHLMGGHEFYLIGGRENPVEIWVIYEKREPEGASSSSRSLVLEQCWASSEDSVNEVLNSLLRHVSEKNRDVLIRCIRRARILGDIRNKGLKPTERTLQIRLLRWFRPVLVFRR
jgi:CelD/BcsL family acetyltransferase involved in cellulose biosynthesis